MPNNTIMDAKRNFLMKLFMITLTVLALSGCASSKTTHNPADPLESFNRGMYQLNVTVDKAVTKPLAQGYNTVMPVPGKIMVSNFFSNLDDLAVTFNDLLQFKFGQAASDSGRLLINSTIGILGLMDVATPTGLAKHHEDFGLTLGYWGVENGPYLMLPVFGPSTVRDGVGLYVDSLSGALHREKHIRTRNLLYLTYATNRRSQLLDQETLLDEAALDRYEFTRDSYLQHRKSLQYDGNPPREKYDDEEDNGSETPK
jgi:phospholipid-binding lipoprotein MlaA